MPYPSALKTNPKCIFFTDFDGTITLMDSGCQIFQNTRVSVLTCCSKAMITWSSSLLYHAPGHCSLNLQTDNLGFGGDLRRKGNQDVLDGKESFRYEQNTWSI